MEPNCILVNKKFLLILEKLNLCTKNVKLRKNWETFPILKKNYLLEIFRLREMKKNHWEKTILLQGKILLYLIWMLWIYCNECTKELIVYKQILLINIADVFLFLNKTNVDIFFTQLMHFCIDLFLIQYFCDC